MKNVTITLEEEVARWARIRAADLRGAATCRERRRPSAVARIPDATISMTAVLVFVDTNVLVYARDSRDPKEQQRAEES